MQIQIVAIFLFFVSVTLITNTLAILFAYRLFTRATSTLTTAVTELRNNSEAREWINSMYVASQRAVAVTESTKRAFADFDPVLGRAHENYMRSLATIDSRLDETAKIINSTAADVRDKIAKPAFSLATVAAGVTKVLEYLEPEE